MVSVTLEPVRACDGWCEAVRFSGLVVRFAGFSWRLGQGSAAEGVPCGQETFYVPAALYWPVGQLVQPESQSES